MTRLPILVLIILAGFFTSCASYQVSTSSLTDQLTGIAVSKGYLLAKDAVKGNELTTLKCIDKNGLEKEIPITDRTGVKITKKDNSKNTFYFNTLLVKDSAIYGSKTHFFNAKIRPIMLADITRIEILP